ncbi:MAG: dTDP-4-dehydrorhamnose 3,5-epimerase family protein [Pirellulales bacterium]|nr:dTDP-4-dehydrorhamnose 3,5-epimerase family protein [Pirellulales bacterium]
MPADEIYSFSEGLIDGVIVKAISPHADQRGWLVELFREDELSADQRPTMAYVSETLPGVARGPHEHVDQTDYFAFVGPGEFMLYLWDARPLSPTRGRRMRLSAGESNKLSATVPPGVVHAYKNIGSTPGWVFNAPNRLFAGPGRRGPIDEIRHEDHPDNPFRLD